MTTAAVYVVKKVINTSAHRYDFPTGLLYTAHVCRILWSTVTVPCFPGDQVIIVKRGQMLSDTFKHSQMRSNMVKRGKMWSNTVNHRQTRSNMVKQGQIWSNTINRVNHGQMWSNRVKCGQTGSNVVMW